VRDREAKVAALVARLVEKTYGKRRARPWPARRSRQGAIHVSLAVVLSRALAGMHSPLVRVEVHVGGGLPGLHVVGLPEAEVREARDRVRAALATARLEFPQSRVIVNLALSGELRPVRGALAMTLAAHRDGHAFVLPESSAAEAALVPGAVVHPAASLLAVCAHLAGRERLARVEGAARPSGADWPDLADVRGQAQARRALEIAAAGGHSLLIL
jgi:magnesium chelatase family protein